MLQRKTLKNIVTFPTELGWVALASSGNIVYELTFAHATADAARAAIATPNAGRAPSGDDKWIKRIVAGLRAYASGKRVDFSDVQINAHALTDFGRRTILECRKIPYGKTLTYGQLAAKAGNHAAARAVGNRMAANRIPIIVPCHRVLPSGRGLGGFSATGGVEMKRLLLEMEACGS